MCYLCVFSNGEIITMASTRLRSLGLKSLVRVGEGKVVIMRNRHLCMADSVNWTALRVAGRSGHTVVRNNRNSALCGS